MPALAISVLIGAILGGLMGYFGKCTGGACPLMATWWRGALYGGTIGLLIGLGPLQGK